MTNVISVGYARTQTKEKIPLFDEIDELKNETKNESKRGRIDKDKKQKELSELQELFNK